MAHDRKIIAILAADVVGYSRLMSVDEESTLENLKLRRTIFDQVVAECGGREFGSVGDSLMAQFPSAVNAVRCAQLIQQRISEENVKGPAEQRMQLRIGVHLGDVIEELGAFFGDAVNVAARLQALAKPGGVLISNAVFDQVRNKHRARYIDAGMHQVKNLAGPLRVFEVLAGLPEKRIAGEPGGSPMEGMTSAAARGSIAVLPFVDLTGDPTKEYFSDGLAEELIPALARVPGLRVPARTSSFAYKGRNIDVRQIARDLDVEVVLEGSVRSAGERIRVTAQLINGESGYQLWSQHYDRRFEDLFELQHDLSTAIVQALSRHLQVELPPTDKQTGPTQDVQAYDLYLQALSLSYRTSLENFRAASHLLRQAVERDPRFAQAFSVLGRVSLSSFSGGMSFDPGHLQAAEDAARHALSLDAGLGEARAVLAQVAAFRADWAGARQEYEIALALNPGEPTLHMTLALFFFQAGHIRKALAEAREADLLAPGLSTVSVYFAITHSIHGLDSDALRYVDKAINLGASPDLQTLQIIQSHAAYRRRDTAAACAHMVEALPANVRKSGGADCVGLVYAALADPGRKPVAISALRGLQASIGGWDSGITIMLMMHWATMLGELDAAFEIANAALEGLQRTGTVGGGVWGGLWIPEMRPFRQDSRFQAFAEGLGLMGYWRRYGAPDNCELRGERLICQ
ncbi:MAG TPA: adenylate/guanylate cyclase domain-containing protein [Steroidobacteraceae bacterium]|nr:adenylate/guanylate cyclase domain-containing protein [Steroidobacteraceae bacterium]